MSLTAEHGVEGAVASSGWVRPLRLGAAIGHSTGSGGVLGAFVRLADGRPALLSAAAAIAPPKAKAGDYVHQPGPTDRLITGETRVAQLIAPPPALSKEADAALAIFAAALLDDIVVVGNRAPEGLAEAGRALLSPVDPAELGLGDELAVLGRSAPARLARLESLEMTLPVMTPTGPVIFTHCLAIVGIGGPASMPGDAGALVYRRGDLAAVGLVFAAAQGDEGLTYVLPLAPALNNLSAAWL